MNIQTLLTKKIEQAMLDCGADVSNGALVRVSAKAQFGDYQANGIMAAAKKAKKILVSWLKKSLLNLI